MTKKGLTLTEVIISVLIISLVAAGMFGSFVGSMRIFNRARHRLQAFNFAKEAMEKLRSNFGYTDTQLNVGEGHLESEIGTVLKGEMTGLGSQLTYDVSEPEPDGYKKVAIRVSWDEKSF